jgi:signal transduction histidine kinase
VRAATKDVPVSVAGPASAVCSVDAPTVRRAIANLVDNAVEYAPPGTAVEIEVRVEADASADSGEGVATVVVTDHGPGIPAGEQAHVFERFWRGRPDTHGTGLGLPIARQIALAHGGDLTVRSPGPAGDGAAFTLTLRR